ncbi:unnamed protein product [Peniophora sp. CBMAI 1063]|nr:unnamed protein product [Peniophora sp. CBMAI 1063]
MTSALSGPSTLTDIITPQFHQNVFQEENFIKTELHIKLDKGCPLGPLHCPLRHTYPSAENFQPPKPAPTHTRDMQRLATVCKHWLRGLCKKGDACEFLHEYNLRRMPDCWWYAKYGYCSSGDECLYSHPREKRVECPDYKRGFCKLGPKCPRKHVRRVACQAYLNGFCPLGPECPKGHPKPQLPQPSEYNPPPLPNQRDLGPPPPGYGRYADFDPTNARSGGGQNYGGGGSAGRSGGGEFSGPPRRNLDEVLCFKCGEKGHYANHCRNRNVPGNRGGVERGPKRYDEE